jgi:hypothetical protein
MMEPRIQFRWVKHEDQMYPDGGFKMTVFEEMPCRLGTVQERVHIFVRLQFKYEGGQWQNILLNDV